MKVIGYIFFFLFFIKGLAQSSELTLLKGKVLVKNKALEGVGVLNLRSEAATQTQYDGNFSIRVKEGDTLAFMGLQVINKKIGISSEIISQSLFIVNLVPRVYQLEEVEITDEFKHINALSLGILQTKPKKYSPAERRLRYVSGFSLESIISSFSGRKALLKKELKVEEKERWLQIIENLFDKTYFTETLKIPEDYVRGFWYYAVEDERLQSALQSRNKALSKFFFTDLASAYLKNFQPENK